jgi:tRNA-dihydrouridine synthase 3
VFPTGTKQAEPTLQISDEAAAETAESANNHAPQNSHKRDRKEKKQKGQNKNREFGSSKDALPLCGSRALQPEFSPLECKFGATCRFEHDLRKYLSQGKRKDLDTFGGVCPVWQARGTCSAGWKCRFVGSHSEEREVDGKKELVLVEDLDRKAALEKKSTTEGEVGVFNVVSTEYKVNLNRRRVKTPRSDAYLEWEGAHSSK